MDAGLILNYLPPTPPPPQSLAHRAGRIGVSVYDLVWPTMLGVILLGGTLHAVADEFNRTGGIAVVRIVGQLLLAGLCFVPLVRVLRGLAADTKKSPGPAQKSDTIGPVVSPPEDPTVAVSPAVLDYAPPPEFRSAWRSDRVVLAIFAVVSGLIGVAILVATIELWVRTWPSFGMTLLAAPAGLVAAAFGSISVAAMKAATQDDSR